MAHNQRTHEQFLIDLETKQPVLYNSIKIVNKYTKAFLRILIQNKYGQCLVKPSHLLNGHFPTVKSAINKTEYFKNELRDKQPKNYNSIEILGEYVNSQIPLLIKTKYGNCLIRPNDLLKGHIPTIVTAINKTEYFINQCIEKHGDLYDYSLVNYVKGDIKVKIISSKGIYHQTPENHLSGQGCPILGFEKACKYQKENPSGSYEDTIYINKALKSNYFNSFKVYIIKCYNDNEVFYKIGKTFTTLKRRFSDKLTMYYNYEAIDCIEFEKSEKGGKECCVLERELQNYFKKYQYIPTKKFNGMYECFYGLPIID